MSRKKGDSIDILTSVQKKQNYYFYLTGFGLKSP